MKKALMTIFALVLTACSTTTPVNYVAAPVQTFENSQVSVGEFDYAPAQRGEVKQNEFQRAKLAIGQLYISENVGDLIQTSLKKELIASGVKINNGSSVKITGTVEKFLFDWIGYVEVDFYLDVRYVITKNGKKVFDDVISTHQAAPKTTLNDPEMVRQAINKNITKLFENYNFNNQK